jgi:hypothetical protein
MSVESVYLFAHQLFWIGSVVDWMNGIEHV